MQNITSLTKSNDDFRAATVHIPQPPPQKTLKALEAKSAARRKKVAEVCQMHSTILSLILKISY